MNPLVWLGLGAAALAGISFLTRRLKARSLSLVSDAEFLERYRTTFADPDKLVLNQRTVIARHLGLPAEALSPDHTFEGLSQYTGFVGEFEVGMGDLETELLELVERADLEQPTSFPATVGELIHEMVRLAPKS
jgi:hypothetical protein